MSCPRFFAGFASQQLGVFFLVRSIDGFPVCRAPALWMDRTGCRLNVPMHHPTCSTPLRQIEESAAVK